MRWRNYMELDQMLTAAANYGFPMLVSCYLLVRMENKIDQLSANIDALTRVIAAAKYKQKRRPLSGVGNY